MRCSKCGSEVQQAPKFCPECGKRFVPVAEPVVANEAEGLYYCAKHHKETTRVRCGRCERPICGKCMVMGPAGVRCRDCARNKVRVRPRGVMHDLGAGAASKGARPVWYLAIFVILFELLSGFFGGNRRI